MQIGDVTDLYHEALDAQIETTVKMIDDYLLLLEDVEHCSADTVESVRQDLLKEIDEKTRVQE